MGCALVYCLFTGEQLNCIASAHRISEMMLILVNAVAHGLENRTANPRSCIPRKRQPFELPFCAVQSSVQSCVFT